MRMTATDFAELAYLEEQSRTALMIHEARDDFWSYCQYMDPEFFSDDKEHLRIIADYLQRVDAGEIKKLMISIMPRAGKSYIVSMFVSWSIGRHPEGSFMRNAYGASLAEKFSYDIRRLIQSEKYQLCFPEIKLMQDKKSVTDWAVVQAKQTTYFCAGVGGAITGKGCDKIAILDDPIKNSEDASSELILEKTWDWYMTTHRTRMEEGCSEILISTRWSRKDPLGKLLEEEGDWTELVIPALDERGESFCPAIKSTEELLKIKEIMDEVWWMSIYMQQPISAKGLLYPIEELNRFTLKDLNKFDDLRNVLGYTDTADKGADYLCSLIGIVYGDYFYLTDVIYTQDGVEITQPMVSQLIIDTECLEMTIESNFGGSSYSRMIQMLLDQEGCKCQVIDKYNSANKETRMIMRSGQVKKYMFFRKDFEHGSDYHLFMTHLTSYVKAGRNKHDDAPDAIAGLTEEWMDTQGITFLT